MGWLWKQLQLEFNIRDEGYFGEDEKSLDTSVFRFVRGCGLLCCRSIHQCTVYDGWLPGHDSKLDTDGLLDVLD